MKLNRFQEIQVRYRARFARHNLDAERVWKLLDLPQAQCFPLIALVLGYPTQEPAHQKGRLDQAFKVLTENRRCIMEWLSTRGSQGILMESPMHLRTHEICGVHNIGGAK
jgi:hypothetical protein